MNFAKRLCADANLIEVINIKSDEDETKNKIITELLNKNRFDIMYRKQVEQMGANGTVGSYVRVDNANVMSDGSVRGGDILINYCDTLNIIPLTVINDEIIECAFTGENIENKKIITTLVIFKIIDNVYHAISTTFDEFGKENQEKYTDITLGDVKPFAIMRNAEVNNLDMHGYGYPKLWNAIPNLKLLDLSYTMWSRDLKKSDKIILMNEVLCSHDKDGNIKDPNEEMKNLFVQLGQQERLPQGEALWKEYNPVVRINDVRESIELALSLLSMSFGYGTKRYSFEQGRIVTATEYVGDRQDAMQDINKQRSESIKYISDLVNALKWFYNSTIKKSLQYCDITIDFDDSYIEDRQAKLEAMRNDALSFGIPKLTAMYLSERYKLSIDEAMKLINEIPFEDDDGNE